MGVSNKSNTNVTFKLVKNATLSGASYVDIDSTNSCMQYDISGSYTSGGTTSFVLPLAQKGHEHLLFSKETIFIEMHPGGTISLLADTGASASVDASIFWEEHF